MKTQPSISFLVTAVSLLNGAIVFGAEGDWPCWRGPSRDGISPATGLLRAWPEGGPEQLWRIPLGMGFSAVSVADGRAYTMYATAADEMVICLDASNGQMIWRRLSGTALENEYGNGPRATPTIDEGRVYTQGATGSLMCLDAASGEKIWGYNTLEKFGAKNLDFGLSASPLVHGQMLVAVVGKGGKSLVALDKTTGDVIWSNLTDKGGYSTPLPINVGGLNQLAVLTGEAIVGTAQLDGRELWRHPWITTLDANVATPIFFQNRLFVASGYGTGCGMFQLASNNDGTSAVELWANKNMKNYFSSSVLIDGYLYGFNNTILTCMEFETGKSVWKQRGFNRGSLTAADHLLFILGERGTLALANASPESYEELARVDEFLEAKTWTVPTIAQGKLFVRNEQELVCLEITAR